MPTEIDHAKEQAKIQVESICQMMKAFNDAENDKERDRAEATIHEDPLEIAVRNDWHAPGSPDKQPAEYFILLCTGGPAVRLIGRLSEHCEPETAQIEYQDWGTPWTELIVTNEN